MKAQGTGEIAPAATRIDACDQGGERQVRIARLFFQHGPELRLQRNRGAMPGDGEGAFLEHGREISFPPAKGRSVFTDVRAAMAPMKRSDGAMRSGSVFDSLCQ